jgi:hypothetical protein
MSTYSISDAAGQHPLSLRYRNQSDSVVIFGTFTRSPSRSGTCSMKSCAIGCTKGESPRWWVLPLSAARNAGDTFVTSIACSCANKSVMLESFGPQSSACTNPDRYELQALNTFAQCANTDTLNLFKQEGYMLNNHARNMRTHRATRGSPRRL